MVRMIAGHGDVVVLQGDGHLLVNGHDAIVTRLDAWILEVLSLDR